MKTETKTEGLKVLHHPGIEEDVIRLSDAREAEERAREEGRMQGQREAAEELTRCARSIIPALGATGSEIRRCKTCGAHDIRQVGDPW